MLYFDYMQCNKHNLFCLINIDLYKDNATNRIS